MTRETTALDRAGRRDKLSGPRGGSAVLPELVWSVRLACLGAAFGLALVVMAMVTVLAGMGES